MEFFKTQIKFLELYVFRMTVVEIGCIKINLNSLFLFSSVYFTLFSSNMMKFSHKNPSLIKALKNLNNGG